MTADFTYQQGVVIDPQTSHLAPAGLGVFKDVAGGIVQPMYDMADNPIDGVQLSDLGVHAAFKADLSRGVLSFGSVDLPTVSIEAIDSSLQAQAAKDAAEAALALTQAYGSDMAFVSGVAELSRTARDEAVAAAVEAEEAATEAATIAAAPAVASAAQAATDSAIAKTEAQNAANLAQDAFEAAQSASIPHVGDGLSGVGTVLDPVKVKTSTTWDAATYGPDTLIGRSIYIDSDGNLRAKPEETVGTVAKFPVTALAGAYPLGKSLMYVNVADGASWPTNTSCTVVTNKTSTATAAQWCYATNAGTTRAFVRTGNNTGWAAWKEIGASLPLGGTSGQALLKQSNADGDANWQTLASAAAPSGVWGTAPLDSATYGTNALTGREIYLDSAGKLRAEPVQLSDVGGKYPVTALPTVYPVGTSVMYVNNTNGVAWPHGSGCFVVTSKASNHACAQWCYSSDSFTNSKAWVRYGTSTTWGPWMQVAPSPVTDLGVVDLDTITATGVYTQSANARATLANNYPITYAGLLEVTVNSATSMVWQRYTVYGHAATGGGVTFTRGMYLGTWQPWVTVGQVSGTWGTDPLLTTYYGSNSMTGREIYRDVNGQLRAKPESISPTATNFPPTALITAYPVGMTSGYIGGVDGAAWPTGSAATLVTWRTPANSGAQWCFSSSSSAAGARAYYRNGTSTAWGNWVDVVAPGLNKKMAAGRVAVTVTSANSGTAAVTFPAGVFSTAPRISVAVIGSSVWVPYSANAPSATGFSAGVRHVDATVSTGTANVDWIAIED